MGLVLLALPGLVAGAWWLSCLRGLDRPPPSRTRLDAATRTSIIVPARDEAAALPRLLASLSASITPPREIIVVDDGSTDGTDEVAHAWEATVIHAPPPPDGWCGKPWACHLGAEAATGDLLVFLDADIWLAPDGLARLLATHAAEPGGLLSVQPFHEVHHRYEQLSAVPNLVSMLASGAFGPTGDRTTVAFGPCLVTSVGSYRLVGGHAGVAREVVEDVELARAFHAVGLPVRVRAGRDAVGFRMYAAGPRAMVEGWTKNLAAGARRTPLPSTVGAVAWVGAGFAIAAAGLGLGDAGPAVVVALWAALATELAWALRRIGTFRWWVAPAFPIAWIGFLGLFIRSAWHRAVVGRVTWRGRDLPVGSR